MQHPKYALGDLVRCEASCPPWTARPITLTIDGLRLVTEYEEEWPTSDGPSVMAAEVGEWEYRLMRRKTEKRFGNEEIEADWGWLKESKLTPGVHYDAAGVRHNGPEEECDNCMDIKRATIAQRQADEESAYRDSQAAPDPEWPTHDHNGNKPPLLAAS